MAKQRVTCGHCRLPIEPDDIIVEFDNSAIIHVRCWRVDEPQMVREASDLVRRSQKLIEDSRRRIDQTKTRSASKATARVSSSRRAS
jgi:hypothetical protein